MSITDDHGAGIDADIFVSFAEAPAGAPIALAPRPRSRLAELRWFITSFCAAFAVINAWSWRPTLSGDEDVTLLVTRRTFGQVLQTLQWDPALEPYYLVIKIWSVAAASTSPEVLRLPMVAAAAMAVAVLVWLVRDATDSATAALAGIIVLTIPAVSQYGGILRPYAFAMLGVVVATAFYWRYLHGGKWWNALGMGAFLCFAVAMWQGPSC